MEDDDSDKMSLDEARGGKLPKYYNIQPWQFVFGMIFVLLIIVLGSISIWNILNETGT